LRSGLLFERRSVPREALFYQKLAEIARDAREQIRAILSRGGQDLIDASVQMKDAIGIGRGVLTTGWEQPPRAAHPRISRSATLSMKK